ncbi:MFS transporter [Paenarthrobacter nitroguajacolicus]|uniref:MFS transporter n=1 Tax=Paenarthrobacter nitroguajacolicus TaxID=211146 RepID=UPI00248BA75C|nr:MFS transporter [Paenarthrobacter nitroguajacolicus]MDI2035596.1 Fosfomycin resistance protein AbaF [Paenarthrobacter nitroguajacolicus]
MHINEFVPETTAPKTPVRAAFASWIGSALEYFDFFIYGTAAALVFNKVFFTGSDPATGTLLALATFGVGYVARPLGAFIVGHIGDRYGRKKVLIGTLLLMGVSTFLVGCLPTYNQIGVWAPILLVVLRLLQGFSASGEQSGATSMSLEHAPERRRAFFTSFTLSGTQFGSVLATAAFIPVAALPEDQLLSWGWRLPFWSSVAVVVAGVIIRRKLQETPAFQEEAAASSTHKLPLVVLFRNHKAGVIRVALAALVSTVSTVFGVYALSFAVNSVHLERNIMLWVGVATNLTALVAIPLFATLADRIGRKRVYLFGTIGSGLLMFLYLSVVSGGNYLLIFTVAILMSGIVYSAQNGIFPAFYSEMFPTQVRLSGMAIGTQIGFAVAGFAPTITAAIAGPGKDGWPPVAIYTLVSCLIAAGAALTARETYDKSLKQIDELHGSDDVPRTVPSRG